MLEGKKIILAVTGSIAAYKTPQLVRLMVKAGAEVKVLLTDAAGKFVSPLALATVSKHPVWNNISEEATWNNHVELGRWADALLVAPCSANTLAKLANGLCDNLVCAVYLSAICPVFIAPAMDEDMWHHPSTKANLDRLRSYGNRVLPVGYGELASGLTGDGRMAEPEEITSFLSAFFGSGASLKGKKALITAGPTYERIDPVRFIGNFSTGRMGIALAETLSARGAEVTLVMGPTHLRTQNPAIRTIPVESAEEMYTACTMYFNTTDIAILSAAVADYRPKERAMEKIKKSSEALDIALVPNPDILAHLGKIKQSGQLLVGFALETTNAVENARKKLQQKNADYIVLNSLQDEGAGFGVDTNKVTILAASGTEFALPLMDKKAVAAAIIDHILEQHEAISQ